MKISLLVFLCLWSISLNAFSRKSVEAYPLETPLKIDGVLDEDAYKHAQPARDFVQLQPYNGKPSFQSSDVYIFYDQTSVYVGAMLYDSSPDSIFDYLTARDDIGMSDYFGIYFDPYNEGQLAFGFFITPAGVQTDIKAVKSTSDNEDASWDAVWESKTRITKNGWVVEMRIPYSALRFPEKDVQSWGLNMFRNIRRYNSNNSWNFIDRTISGFIHQEGELTNIKNIKPPVRLAFYPYAATYMEFKDGSSNPNFVYKCGMDVKYGINESFTLDMMLIPDFGQIQSDDKQLNLSPYELYYSEKRQFFTEGMELFQRAGIFYSRRIGASPKFNLIGDNEVYDFRPSETQLVNATKISGRTKNDWGIGFMNAMSLPSYSTVLDTITNKKRDIIEQPFTNYNISVIDKSLKNNGYFSIINSNVKMINNPFIANVTATEFQLRNKNKSFAFKGKGAYSYRKYDSKDEGYLGNLTTEKNSGKLRFGVTQYLCSDKYNPNDLGYLKRNNEIYSELYGTFQIVEPFWIVREWTSYSSYYYRRMYNPNVYAGGEFYLETDILLKNNYELYANWGGETNKHNYYEARVDGRYLKETYYFYKNFYVCTDTRKNFNGYVDIGGFKHPDTDRSGIWMNAGINLRAGHKLQISAYCNFENMYNNYGYVDNSDDSVYIASRDVDYIENIIQATLAVNNKTNFSVRLRHYWSGALNHSYHTLLPNGDLSSYNIDIGNYDENYNTFNIDWGFKWNFAPGSELSLAWKNSITDSRELYTANYWKNLDIVWNTKQTNTFSLRILYFIDYNKLRKKKKDSDSPTVFESKKEWLAELHNRK